MFFELREYRPKPDMRDAFVKRWEEVVIPFQMSKGMVIVGSFVSPEEDDLYVWIRRFENEEEYQRIYKAVYDSDTWKNEISPINRTMHYPEKIVVRRLEATPGSVIH